MSIITITNENFKSEVMDSNETILLDFWASWCGPCRMLSPVIEQIAEERKDIKIGKINIDEQKELAISFQIQSVPTLMVIKDGKVKEVSIGYKTKDQILKILK